MRNERGKQSGQTGEPFSFVLFGEEIWGPLLAGICRWLLQKAAEDGVQKLFFLARDSYLLYRICKICEGPETPALCYLELSREMLGIPDSEAEDPGKTPGCPEATLRYLQSYSLRGKCGIVDVGWHGSICMRLCELLSPGITDITAYFIGYIPGKGRNLRIRSYLGCRESREAEAYVGLWELLLMEDVGKLCGYHQKEYGWAVERKPHVPCGTACCPDGTFRTDFREEWLLLRCKAEEKAALLLKTENPGVIGNAGKAAGEFHRIGICPSQREVQALGQFLFQDDGDYFPLALPSHPSVYFRNPLQLVSDYRASRWKSGFLSRLLPLPGTALVLWGILKRVGSLRKLLPGRSAELSGNAYTFSGSRKRRILL